MYCKKCGNEINDERIRFCPECGTPVDYTLPNSIPLTSEDAKITKSETLQNVQPSNNITKPVIESENQNAFDVPLELLERANAGDTNSMIQIGIYYLKNGDYFDKPKEWFEKAAKAGNIEGVLRLFFLYAAEIRTYKCITAYEDAIEEYLIFYKYYTKILESESPLNTEGKEKTIQTLKTVTNDVAFCYYKLEKYSEALSTLEKVPELKNDLYTRLLKGLCLSELSNNTDEWINNLIIYETEDLTSFFGSELTNEERTAFILGYAYLALYYKEHNKPNQARNILKKGKQEITFEGASEFFDNYLNGEFNNNGSNINVRNQNKITNSPQNSKSNSSGHLSFTIIVAAMLAITVLIIIFNSTLKSSNKHLIQNSNITNDVYNQATLSSENTKEVENNESDLENSETKSENETVASNESPSIIGKVTVKVNKLRIRSKASTSGEKLGYAENGKTYDVYEVKSGSKYTWYRIGDNQWIADDGSWITYNVSENDSVSENSETKSENETVTSNELPSIIGKATVKVNKLRIRSKASTSGEKLGYAENGKTYDVYEVKFGSKYTWYRIGDNQWIADDGSWITYKRN